MDESVVFQVNAYMGGATFIASVVEEYQVSFTQFSFAYFVAVFFALFVRVPFQPFAVYFAVNVVG